MLLARFLKPGYISERAAEKFFTVVHLACTVEPYQGSYLTSKAVYLFEDIRSVTF